MLGYKIDILNLEWPNSDRDRNIITPVYLYLREKYKLSIKSENIFNGHYYLLKYRPRLLLLSNSVGSNINYLITKVAYGMGIKVISLISEGNISDERKTDGFLWGWNTDKILYEDTKILWSLKSKNIIIERYPNLANKFFVSGATGFDRYKLLQFMDKKYFLIKNNLKRYEKIVGIAGWGFDQFFEGSITWDREKKMYFDKFDKKEFEMHRSDLFLLKGIYKRLIEYNKDILFILRFHPANGNFERSEFWGLDTYENVYISNPAIKLNNYPISDLINISDLWIGYNSTTALEAWLLGKTTFFINPTRSDFIRDKIFKGLPIATNYNETQRFIDEFFKDGKISKFDALEGIRRKIIQDVIEYSDGKNHIRAAEIIYRIFSEKNKNKLESIKCNNFPFIKMLKQFLRFSLSKRSKINSEVEYYENLYKEAIKKELNKNEK